jgi:hypothetical protein
MKTFYLSEFKTKFETRSDGIFMFCVDKNLHCKMKNQRGNQYGVTFIQKTFMFKYLMNLNGQ